MSRGPSSLRSSSSIKKRIRKRQKHELTSWPFGELVKESLRSTETIKGATVATCKVDKPATSGLDKPTTTVDTSRPETIKVQNTPQSDQMKPLTGTKTTTMAMSKVQEPPLAATAPGLRKEHIEQHALRVLPQPGAAMQAVEKAIRSIESPCGNVVWSSSRTRRLGTGRTPAALEIKVIYNNCSRHKTMPFACRRMHGIPRRASPPSQHETLTMQEVVARVRGLTELVAQCEVTALESCALNAVSYGGSPKVPRPSCK
jgi:hypothetical protein